MRITRRRGEGPRAKGQGPREKTAARRSLCRQSSFRSPLPRAPVPRPSALCPWPLAPGPSAIDAAHNRSANVWYSPFGPRGVCAASVRAPSTGRTPQESVANIWPIWPVWPCWPSGSQSNMSMRNINLKEVQPVRGRGWWPHGQPPSLVVSHRPPVSTAQPLSISCTVRKQIISNRAKDYRMDPLRHESCNFHHETWPNRVQNLGILPDSTRRCLINSHIPRSRVWCVSSGNRSKGSCQIKTQALHNACFGAPVASRRVM